MSSIRINSVLWILGAYYVQYYAKGQRLQNMTYEESLIKYKAYADQLGIPFR